MFTQLVRLVVAFAAFFVTGSAFAQPVMFLPFSNGTEVRCVQGNDGSFSHSGTLRYSYDFDMGPGPNDTSNPAYGLGVYAPFSGVITDLRTGVADFVNNTSSNTSNNGGLGNTIQIRVTGNDGTIYFVRFAHLKYGSIPSTLRVGGTVAQGALIGRIGQTGYSTSPHLHMHLSVRASGDSLSAPHYGASAPFEFIEGPISTGTWEISELEANKFVVDNSGRATLGFPLSSVAASVVSGTWGNFTPTTNSAGANYRTSSSTSAAFRWAFGYSVPASSNVRLRMMARCPQNSTRDRAAVYSVTTSGTTSTINATIDQRYIGSTPATIGTATLSAGTSATTRTITVQVRRGANTTCADGIVVYRL